MSLDGTVSLCLDALTAIKTRELLSPVLEVGVGPTYLS